MPIVVTDNDKLHRRFYLTTQFQTKDCGCVWRGDGQQIHKCGKRILDKNGLPTLGHEPNISLGGKRSYSER